MGPTLMKPIRFRFMSSLRLKVILFFVIPTLFAMSFTTISHYIHEQRVLEAQLELTAVQLANIAVGGLRHAMLVNDSRMILDVMQEIEKQDNIESILLVDLDGLVKGSGQADLIGALEDTNQLGCVECHQYPANERPRVTYIVDNDSIMRVSTPIANEPPCQGCHDPQDDHLGVMLIDTSMVDVVSQMRSGLTVSLLSTAAVTFLLLGLGYVVIQRLIIDRIESINRAISAYAGGDPPAPSQPTWNTRDELSQLAATFYELVNRLELQKEAQAKVQRIRQQAIVEERERIARELHDGVAQMLGYVATKVMAIRLNIRKRQNKKAEEQLVQIAEAVDQQSIDVRASILGLKMAGQSGIGLDEQIRDFVAQCSRLSDLPIRVSISPEAEGLHLDAERELQLMRIVQEALSNVRKHAHATQAKIELRLEAGELFLRISDDGVGFDLWEIHFDKHPSFGLETMRERTEAIGGTFHIHAGPEAGTVVTVQLKLED